MSARRQEALVGGSLSLSLSLRFLALGAGADTSAQVLPHNRLSLRTSCGGNPEEGWCNVEACKNKPLCRL